MIGIDRSVELKKNQLITTLGSCGFLSYTYFDVLSVVGTYFSGFGIDGTIGDETKNSRMAIPISIRLVLFIVLMLIS